MKKDAKAQLAPTLAAARSVNSTFWKTPPDKATVAQVRSEDREPGDSDNDARRHCIVEPGGNDRRRYAGDHVLGHVSHQFGPDYPDRSRAFHQHRVCRHLPGSASCSSSIAACPS